ncbi:MAG: energy transducer TonB [Sandaracinaceae bacterium]|nr:energy transducer TonB [Sandaracinaceae bacterium]
MALNAATERSVILPVGISLLVHAAVILVFPAVPEAVLAEPPGASDLLWLSSVGGSDGAGSEGSPQTMAQEPAVGRARAVRHVRTGARHVAASRASRGHGDAPSVSGDAGRESSAVPSGSEPARGREAEEDRGGGATPGDGAGPLGTAAGAGAGGGTGPSTAGASGGGHGPTLVAWSNPCAGFFPSGAHTAHGTVQVEVEVGVNGQPAGARVMAEEPRGEGFGGAARACAERLRFRPATSTSGTPVAGRARLLLRFDRS